MTPSLQNQLFEKYPEIFAQRKLPMDKTCMCWGIEPGDGWYNIIDTLCHNIMEHSKLQNQPPPQFAQVKEKWGLLTIYADNCDEFCFNLISDAEVESAQICEDCGAFGKTRNMSWIRTLCDKCYNKTDGE